MSSPQLPNARSHLLRPGPVADATNEHNPNPVDARLGKPTNCVGSDGYLGYKTRPTEGGFRSPGKNSERTRYS